MKNAASPGGDVGRVPPKRKQSRRHVEVLIDLEPRVDAITAGQRIEGDRRAGIGRVHVENLVAESAPFDDRR